MSTERVFSLRAVASGAGFLLLATRAANAAEVDFRPSLSFGVFYNGNIAVVGKGGGDDGARLALDLAIDRKTPTSSFTVSYRPFYEAYGISNDLNFFGNTLAVGYSRDGARAARFRFDMYLARTENQGPTFQNADTVTTFVPRTTVTQGSMRIGGAIPAGKRGFVDMEARVWADRYVDLADNPATTVPDINRVDIPDPVDFNDQTAAYAKLAWRSEISRRNSLGVGIDGSYFNYENFDSVVVESINVVGRSQPGESWLLDYSLGGSRATSGSDSITGVSFDATIAYTPEAESTFSAGARQVFAPGTAFGATTQDRGVWFAYAHAPTARGLSGTVIGGYWQREELEFANSTSTAPQGAKSASYVVNGLIGWKFNRFIAVDANGVFVNQSARNGLPSSFETSYASYGLYLRWAIRGR